MQPPGATLVDILCRRAADTPRRRVLTFLRDGEKEAAHLTFGELDRRARAVATALQRRTGPGERVLLLFPPGLDFAVGFLGCLYAGVVAVPTYPPRRNRPEPRLLATLRDAEASLILTNRAALPRLAGLAEKVPDLADLERVAADDPDGTPEAWHRPDLRPDSLAFLQYTSGSTSSPKGVMVSHGNLVHNEEAIRRAFGTDEGSVVVSWLPLYHDMGLIGGLLHPLYLGARCILMSPLAFLQRPRRWLEVMSRYRATVSGGPNFAYDLLVERAGEAAEREGLDLSSWRVAFNGSEPVRAATLRRFADAFGPCGFRLPAFYPCFGLAEATLFVSGGSWRDAPVMETVDAAALGRSRAAPATAGGAGRELVGCGGAWSEHRVVIADPDTGRPSPAGCVGEIWVAGPSIARGYWNRPHETARTFGAHLADDPAAGPFLRTGDLGFLRRGELFVTGRIKDLIIIRGRNHYPQDLELTGEGASPELRRGSSAAFSVEVAGEERLVMVHEVPRGRPLETDRVAEAVRRAVAEEHEVNVYEVMLLPAGSVPKTSSGKVQRHLCRSHYLEGRWQPVGRSALVDSGEAGAAAELPSRRDLLGRPPEERRRLLEEAVASQAAAVARVDPGRIPRDRPLTALGVDSLAAVELAQRLQAGLGVPISVTGLLAGASAAEVAAQLDSSLDAVIEPDREEAPPETAVSGEQDLSYGQQALWFVSRLAPDSAAYHIAAAARLHPPLDAGALRRAVRLLGHRHSALRTTFTVVDGTPRARVGADPEPTCIEEDATALSGPELSARLQQEALRPFDLGEGPLLRLRIFRRGSQDVLLLVVHHIVADFWSLGILARELGALYHQETGGPPAQLPPLPWSYGDYVGWQVRQLAGPEGEALRQAWRRQLSPPPPALDLPTDRPRPAIQTYAGGAASWRAPRGLLDRLTAVAGTRGATPFMALLAAFQALLHRYTGQEDLVVGVPAAGRTRPQMAGMLGYFVNPLPLRADLGGDPTFATLVERTRDRVASAFGHQGYPFLLLARELEIGHDPSRSPVFQAMLVWQRAAREEEQSLAAYAVGLEGVRSRLGEVELESMALPLGTSQLDLTLTAAAVGGELAGRLQYNSDLFDAASAQRMVGHLQCLLADALAHPERPVSALAYLTPAEESQLLRQWSDGGPLPATEATLSELLAAQRRSRPEAVALVHGDERLTYGELGQRSEALAAILRRRGVSAEKRVGVLLERSPDLVVAILGTLHAGAAYVPLDPAYPRERLAFMLADSGAATLLTRRSLLSRLGPEPPPVPPLFLEAGTAPSPERALPPPPSPSPAALSHVIYTSGSTGRPKGVAIRRASVAALLRWAHGAFSAAEMAGVVAATSVCFDLSVFELLAPLSAGGKVVLVRDILELASSAGAGEVSLVNTVPSAMTELVRLGALPSSVLTVNLAGEPLQGSLVRRIRALCPRVRVLNLYGPSEDTTYSTAAAVEPAAAGEPTIGRPLAGSRLYLLDRQGRPVPAGVPGELCLGGAGLARGYLGQPAATAARFLPDPLAESPGARLYRTGDVARFGPAGEVEFLGRLDHQVKIRGFRIELGEVEAALGEQVQVGEAAVAVAGGSRLVAYVAPEEGATLDAETLRAHLGARLPGYMLPSQFVFLEALPRTPNGKLDRKALPHPRDPETTARGAPPHSPPPQTPLEELLAAMWAEVLDVEAVGREDDFFALGGHSLLATQVLSRIKEALGVELPVRQLFHSPTVAALAAEVAARRAGTASPAPPLLPTPRGGRLPLSFAQERLWFLDQLDPEQATYNLPAALLFRGRLEIPCLERAFKALIERHESLRTSFPAAAGQPVQHIAATAPCELPLADVSGLPAVARRPVARQLGRAEARRPFDLARGPLMRVRLLRLGATEHAALVTLHHIITDGWSMRVLTRELAALYAAAAERRPEGLPPLSVHYADFAVWQRGWLSGEVLERQLRYWRSKLMPPPEPLELPADRPRPAVPTHGGGTCEATVSRHLTAALRALGRRHGSTVFMTLLTAFATLVHRITGRREFTLGSPIANRTVREVEDLVGYFANTLVLRLQVGGDDSFLSLLARVREETLEAYAHQDVPFEKLVEDLQPQRDLSHTPLFQVMISMDAAPPASIQLPEVELGVLELETRTAKFDLTLAIEETADDILILLEYDDDLFDRTTVLRLLGRYLRLLAGVAAEPERCLASLALLSRAQRHQLLHEWNHAMQAPAPAACIHQLFETWARSQPHALALVDWRHLKAPPALLTYGELNRRANRLAHHLSSLGIGPEGRVALCLERSVEMVVAVLGVLKAGGAYVPIDPAHPEERNAFLVEDPGARAVITRSPLLDRLPLLDGQEVLCLDTDAPLLERAPDHDLNSGVGPWNAAYLIYTSGSTGRPKGVLVEHRSVVNYVATEGLSYTVGPGDRVLQIASLSFDASVEEINMALCHGATLVLRNNTMLGSVAEFRHACQLWGVSFLALPTVYWHEIAAELEGEGGLPPAVRVVELGGEKVLAESFGGRRRPAGRHVQLCNVYGPTEATILATRWSASDGEGLPHDVPIGRPIANLQAYVLGTVEEPLAVGVPGELLLGGAGLARGYLRHPALTAQAFVPHPWGRGERLYRTGDLVRWLPRGNLQFLGRTDEQVKIRGFRVECGEVEARLTQHPGVREAVVLAREEAPGRPRLVGYVVPRREGEAPAATELRSHLTQWLPEYMVPTAFVFLEVMPVTATDKVDRRALPPPDFAAASGAAPYAPPRTPMEEVVAATWATVLGVERVGLHDDFFSLGGHSLLATQVVSRLRAVVEVDLRLRELFEAPTVAGLAAALETARQRRGAAPPAMEPVPRGGPLTLSFAQERLWFLDRLEPASPAYNLAAAMVLEGPLDARSLAAALAAVVRRHEALRTTFDTIGGRPVQRIAPPGAPPQPVVDLTALPATERRRVAGSLATAEARRPFDLERGPLLRTTLLRLAGGEHAVVVNLHHIVSDGWSIEVLVRELSAEYAARRRGLPSPLEPLPVQYADFAAWQRRYLSGDELERQLAYWRRQLGGLPEALALPTDHPRPAVASPRGATLPVHLGADLAAGLHNLASQWGATLFMVLLGGFSTLLHRYTGARDLAVAAPIANRNHAQTEDLIGFFVNTLVLRVEMDGEDTFASLLQGVRESTLGAYAHQDLPFEKLVEELRPERSLAHAPLCQVMLVLQNAPAARLELPGVQARPWHLDTGTAKFDLTLALEATDDGLDGHLEYGRDLYDEATVRRLGHHLEVLLKEAAADAERPIGELPLLTAGERHQLLTEWNDTAPAAAPAVTLPGLVAAQGRRTPERIALVKGFEYFTYAGLARRAGTLAHGLSALGVGAEDPVALCTPRTPQMIWALLAILQAGGAYVPLDPAYPEDRLRFMLADCGAALVLAQGEAAKRLSTAAGGAGEDGRSPRHLDLDAAATPAPPVALAPRAPAVDPEQVAYLIYTSGSTGRPKAVAIRHGGAAVLLHWAVRHFGARRLARMAASTSISFDLAVFEIFAPLACGGTVLLLDDALSLAESAAVARVTFVNTVPSAAAALLRSGRFAAPGRTVGLAGEPLRRSLVEELYRDAGAQEVYNLYGPSEDTTYTTWARIAAGATTDPDIGRPLTGTRTHVLDHRLQPLPAAVPGELLVAGAGLARGYWRRPALTAERFLPDPTAPAPGERLYRTGDLARRLADGRLEHLGRLDHQVKIRGFRIELGEIQTTLEAQDEVLEVVVVAREDAAGERRLVAYAVTGGEGVESEDLTARLRQKLPAYMVPSAFVFLPSLPLTPNGKVDRRALPAPEPAAAKALPTSPRSPGEELVAGIFAAVLGRESVGPEDSFFALGGHSLLATQVVSRLRDAVGVELPLKHVFAQPTAAGLAAALEAEARGAETAPPLTAVDRGAESPPSFAQERLWLLEQLDPGNTAYNLPAAASLRGELAVPALGTALAHLLRRHEALRTTFRRRAGKPVQVICPPPVPRLAVVDLSALPAATAVELSRRLAQAEADRPFDLRRGPLLRTCLLRCDPRHHALLLTLHHLVADGWSLGVLIREVASLYTATVGGGQPELEPLPVQYADYALWQRRWLHGERLDGEVAYWRRQLEGLEPLELPADRARPAAALHRAGVVRFRVPAALAASLRRLARDRDATLFMVLLAAFQALLHRHTGATDLSVGTPIAARDRTEIEGLIGFFVNTLVLRTRVAGALAFDELLARVRESTLAAFTHRSVPFEKLVEALQPRRDLAHTPLFQVVLALQPGPLAVDMPGLEVELLESASSTAKFDLSLSLLEEGDGGLAATLEHSRDLFDRTRMARMSHHWLAVLDAVTRDGGRRVGELPLLSTAERWQLCGEWSGGRATFEAGAPIHTLFEEQASRRPHGVALAAAGEALSYGELNRRANRLAHRLLDRGVGPEVPVGLCFQRSVEMVVAILATLKAGGAYVPLDPAYPEERLAFMLEDSGVPLVLSHGEEAVALEARGASILRLDGAPSTAEPDSGCGNPSLPLDAENLAYIIYTSGSTGRPKGTLLSHRNVHRLLAGTEEWFGFGPGDVWTLFHSYAFDFSVWELWGALAYGGRLVVVPYWVSRSPEAFHEVLARERVTVLNQTPSAFRQLAAVDEETSDPGRPAPSWVIFGGEALELPGLAPWLEGRGDHPPRLVNMYGITETTVHVTYRPVGDGDLARGHRATLGEPIPDLRLYLLDPRGRPVALGVPGEIHVGGPGLARGYLRRPGLTAERFVPDPFSPAGGDRLYRAGDLGRFRTDGDLEYLGRMDHQVKVRGFRIELGEIEAALAEHPAVQAAVATVHDAGPDDRRLLAFLVLRPGEGEPAAASLRQFLAPRLPDYMIPAAFASLPSLPLTPTGKVDRRGLPVAVTVPREAPGEAPRTPVEEVLAGLWGDLLQQPRIGRHASFFDLGGHSLLAAQAVSRIRRSLGVEIPLRTLFEAPTLAALALEVERALVGGEAPPPPIEPRAGRGWTSAPEAPLSFAQQRLWLSEQMDPGRPTYNIPMALALEGELDAGALTSSLTEIVRRHEVLRTTYPSRGEEAVQRVAAPAPLTLPVVDLRRVAPPHRRLLEAALIRREAARPFDLARGPVLRSRLLRLDGDRHRLLVTLHHIAGDAWSLGLLTREMASLYPAFRRGEPPPLPELSIQYGDYAAWQRRYLSGEVLEGELAYWRRQLSGAPPVLGLPTDRPRPAVRSSRGASVALVLEPPLVTALNGLGRRRGATPFMTALAALKALLMRYTGEGDLSVGAPIAGRHHLATEELIGFFVNTLVLRTRSAPGTSFGDLVERVRDTALEAYRHQELPFDKVVEALEPQRSRNHSPLFQVLCALQNAPVAELSLPDLEVDDLSASTETEKFDLTLVLSPRGDALKAELSYSTDLFDATTALRLLRHYRDLLAAACRDPDLPVGALALLSAAEAHELLWEWNDRGSAFPREMAVHTLFEAQAAKRPDAVALVAGDEALTYAAVHRRAARLAHRLQHLGVAAEDRVAVMAERSPALVVALLGILKAGGVYVPLDPDQPQERLAWMCRHTRLALAAAHLAPRLPAEGLEIVSLDGEGAASSGRGRGEPGEHHGPRQRPGARREPGSDGDRLAYVVYTSGSTGRPKGVAVPHRGITRLLLGTDYVHLCPQDRIAQASNASFDAATFEIWGALLHGAQLVFVPKEVALSPKQLARFLRRRGVSTLFLTTALFNQLLAEEPAAFASLRHLMFGGEAVDPTAVRRCLDAGPPDRLLHVYGPTESTTFSSWKPLRAVPPGATNLPIGRPIANTRILLLDQSLEPVPMGVWGEILIGGDGLARGYEASPALTAQRFIPHPWEPGRRLYRTGDLARQLPAGDVEFLGRRDHQVKIRGFRIELAEIESVLGEHPAVKESVVVAQEEGDGEKWLAAYVVPEGTDRRASEGASEPEVQGLTAEEMRHHLAARLPAYMVPTAFIFLHTLPLNPNGKVDRRALPEPHRSTLGAGAPFAPPTTQLEELLAGIWSRLLGVDRLGVEDDFFELGGHSLLATRLTSNLSRALGVEVPLPVLFEAPTVRQLAARLEEGLADSGSGDPPAMEAAPRHGPPPLSYAQERLWFLDQLEPGSPVYNVGTALQLAGPLSVEALAAACRRLVARHESLRTTFPTVDGEPVQAIAAPGSVPLPVVDLSSLDGGPRDELIGRLASAEAQRPFQLHRGPLLRLSLLRCDNQSHALLATLHHIVCDAWSVEILVRELAVLYRALLTGGEPALPSVALQYADFAAWQRRWLETGEMDRLLAYWRRHLGRRPPRLALPTDRDRPAQPSHRGAQHPFRLQPELAAAVTALSRRESATEFMTLLTALKVLLARTAGEDDVVVGVNIANRGRRQTQGMIGFFVNMLALRTDVSGDPSFQDLLRRVRRAVLGAFAHQDLPYEKLVERLGLGGDGAPPLFDVAFNFHDTSAETTAAEALAGSELELTELERAEEPVRRDLTLVMTRANGAYEGSWVYATDLFEAATIVRLHHRFETLLASAATHPDAPVGELEMVGAEERREEEEAQSAWEESQLDDLLGAEPEMVEI